MNEPEYTNDLTIRDWFAGMALQGMIASWDDKDNRIFSVFSATERMRLFAAHASRQDLHPVRRGSEPSSHFGGILGGFRAKHTCRVMLEARKK